MPRSKPPLAVWTAMALHLGVMVIFTLLYPAYWGFDETGHVSRVLDSQHGDLYPTPGVAAYVVGVNDTYQMFNLKDQPPFIAYVPLPRADRPSFDSLGGGTLEPEPAAVPNQLAQHPPGYYALAAGVLDAVPGTANLAWDQTVGLLRLLDILFLLPLPYLCWAIAKRYTRGGVAVATAFAPILLPALERLGGSVNNDDLLILLTSVFLLQVTKAMAGDMRIRVAVTMGVSLILALLTKGLRARLAAGRGVGLSRRVAAQPLAVPPMAGAHRRARLARSVACGGFATSTSTAAFNRPDSPRRRRTRYGPHCLQVRPCTWRRTRTTRSIA